MSGTSRATFVQEFAPIYPRIVDRLQGQQQSTAVVHEKSPARYEDIDIFITKLLMSKNFVPSPLNPELTLTWVKGLEARDLPGKQMLGPALVLAISDKDAIQCPLREALELTLIERRSFPSQVSTQVVFRYHVLVPGNLVRCTYLKAYVMAKKNPTLCTAFTYVFAWKLHTRRREG